jgi:hypothetical protein
MILAMMHARRHDRGQKPEEIYVIQDKQLEDRGPDRRIIVTEDRRMPATVM